MGVVRTVVGIARNAPGLRNFVRGLILGSKGGNRTVRSADGTELSVRVSGDGPPLVLVHGALDGINTFSFVEPALAERFTVWVYDRRGRRASLDADPDATYDIGREVDDLRAVIDATGAPAAVIGHSYGALIAMLAALDGVAMRSLVLYEPPINGAEIDSATIDEIERLVADDRPDDAIRLMAGDLAGVSDDELAVAFAIPPARKALREGTASVVRELRAVHAHRCATEPIRGTDVLVLQGERRSSAAYPTDEQAASLAESTKVVALSGQGHLAHTFRSGHFVDVVVDFLD